MLDKSWRHQCVGPRCWTNLRGLECSVLFEMLMLGDFLSLSSTCRQKSHEATLQVWLHIFLELIQWHLDIRKHIVFLFVCQKKKCPAILHWAPDNQHLLILNQKFYMRLLSDFMCTVCTLSDMWCTVTFSRVCLNVRQEKQQGFNINTGKILFYCWINV